MRGSRLAPALLSVAFLALAACGTDAATADGDSASRCLPDAVDCHDTDAPPPAAGMCLEGTVDCVDTVDENGVAVGEPSGDQFDSESEKEAAQAMVGLAEDELAPDVRIGRKGDEHMVLTEDYVLGRKTVELDVDADGVFRVTKVTVELPEGPVSYST